MGGVVQESNLGETLVIKEEVLDHCDVVYAALSKATHLKTLFCSEKWEEKKRELHLLCQALREGSAGEEVCSLFHLEQTWGVKNENVEVLWALLKSLGSVTLKDGSELVSVPELAQITYISLVLKEAALKRRKKALLVPNVVGKRTPELQTDFDTRSKVRLVLLSELQYHFLLTFSLSVESFRGSLRIHSTADTWSATNVHELELSCHTS